jgi:hypothetical protein
MGASLGLDLRQAWFAGYWANDVVWYPQYGGVLSETRLTADEIGFAPWGNAGPGSLLDYANVIIDDMRQAGYQLPDDAPYTGPGYDEHGSSEQFLAAVEFLDGKVRGK